MRSLHRFMNTISQILAIFLMCFMVLMIFTVVWQVFTRFVIRDPSTFTDELSRYLLIWVGILGGAYTFIIKRHLALELLLLRYKPHVKKYYILTTIINALVIIFTGVAFLYGGVVLTSNTLLHHQISPGLAIGTHHLLMGYVYIIVPISGILIIAYSAYDIIVNTVQLANSDHKGGHHQ